MKILKCPFGCVFCQIHSYLYIFGLLITKALVVIAFPKTQNHSCLMMDAPGQASLDQLIDLGISVDELL